MKTFECCRCATCCTHIRGQIGAEDKEFIEEFYYGKLPIVWLIPLEQMTFPILPWEAKRLRKLRPDIELKPLRIIFDLHTNRSIVVAYYLDAESCPFLDGKECIIYEKRPYICKQFPIQHVDLDDGKIIVSNLCNMVDKDVSQEDMPAYFGKSYEEAVRHSKAIRWFNQAVFELIKSGTIRPAIKYPYEFLMKRYENSEKIDFLDFLREKNIPIYDEASKES